MTAGGDKRAGIGPRVEDAGRKRPLPFRKPQRHRLDRRREVARLAQAQRRARGDEPAEAAHQRMSRRRETPRDDGHRVADLGAEPVHKPAKAQQADAVSELEGGVHPAELLVGPADFLVENLLKQRQNLPVNIVDRRREEQQRANDPTVVADRAGLGDWGREVRTSLCRLSWASCAQPLTLLLPRSSL